MPASTPVVVLAFLMVRVGLARPLVMPPITCLLLQVVRTGQAGARGVCHTPRQVEGALAIAVFGALLASRDKFRARPAGQLAGFAAVDSATTAAVSLLFNPSSRKGDTT